VLAVDLLQVQQAVNNQLNVMLYSAPPGFRSARDRRERIILALSLERPTEGM
jgi:hypothetical protein